MNAKDITKSHEFMLNTCSNTGMTGSFTGQNNIKQYADNEKQKHPNSGRDMIMTEEFVSELDQTEHFENDVSGLAINN